MCSAVRSWRPQWQVADGASVIFLGMRALSRLWPVSSLMTTACCHRWRKWKSSLSVRRRRGCSDESFRFLQTFFLSTLTKCMVLTYYQDVRPSFSVQSRPVLQAECASSVSPSPCCLGDKRWLLLLSSPVLVIWIYAMFFCLICWLYAHTCIYTWMMYACVQLALWTCYVFVWKLVRSSYNVSCIKFTYSEREREKWCLVILFLLISSLARTNC